MWTLQWCMCQERRKKNTATTKQKLYIFSISDPDWIKHLLYHLWCDTQRWCQIRWDGRSLLWLDGIQAATSGAGRRQRGEQQSVESAEINNLLCTLTGYWSESEIIDHFVAGVIDACIVAIATQKVRSLANNVADSPSFRSASINQPDLLAEQSLNTLSVCGPLDVEDFIFSIWTHIFGNFIDLPKSKLYNSLHSSFLCWPWWDLQ